MGIENKIHYRVIECDETYYYEMTTAWDIDINPELIAQDAAFDFFTKHGGWDTSWPLTIALHNFNGEERIRMLVKINIVPEFFAKRIKTSI